MNSTTPIRCKVLCRCAALALFISASLLTACGNTSSLQNDTTNSTTVDTLPADEATDQGTPVDLMPLAQFPTTDAHLSVSLSDDRTRADISYDGKVIQTITDEEEGLVSGGDNVPARFLDANFDGFTDIFVGMGESRTYSALLIHDAETQQFHRIGALGNPCLQGFMLDPASKSVIEGGSNSYCEFGITRSQWEDDKLVVRESLTIITDPSQYHMNGFEHRYTLRDAEERVLCSTEDLESLPELWQSIVKEYGY